MARKTVCVAMSGGVDSAVVAAILKKRGYEVIGVTMQIWQESQRDPRHSGCCSLGAVEDARRCANHLDIPHYVVNFKDAFRRTVIDEFVDEYVRGRTPNPCVTCNKKVKFESLWDVVNRLGCDALATGHYARVRHRKSGPALLRSKGGHKDQSYVLYMMDALHLDKTMFPLGELGDKSHTRQLARDYGLPVADKPDSQEVCFVSEAGGYREFLRKERPDAFVAGELVDAAGRIVGQHQGVADYTVGQRRGLGLAVGQPLYVIGVEPTTRRVIVGSDEELLQTTVWLEESVWTGASGPPAGAACWPVKAKIRYNMDPQPATLYSGEQPRLEFSRPVRAVTPGQIAVAYLGETVLMGAKICSAPLR